MRQYANLVRGERLEITAPALAAPVRPRGGSPQTPARDASACLAPIC